VVDVWPLLDELVGSYGAHDWWLTGMRAFARTEQMRFEEAEDLAGAALAAEPASGHAAHALAHVYYETGRHDESIRWLDGWLDGAGTRQLFRGHFQWHAGLSELVKGDADAVRRRYDRELAGLAGTRALVDAGSLLARARAHGLGLDLGQARADAVDAAAGEASRRPRSPFLAWNAALLAGVRADADRLEQLEAHARSQAAVTGPSAGAWDQVVCVCRAVQAGLRADPARAAALLGTLGDTTPVGGSPAQRELLDDVALQCLRTAGEGDAARRLAAARLARRPSAFDAALCEQALIS
jgi:hypothetical protein